MKLFHFTPFGRKRLQTASEAGEETLPNGDLDRSIDKWDESRFVSFRDRPIMP